MSVIFIQFLKLMKKLDFSKDLSCPLDNNCRKTQAVFPFFLFFFSIDRLRIAVTGVSSKTPSLVRPDCQQRECTSTLVRKKNRERESKEMEERDRDREKRAFPSVSQSVRYTQRVRTATPRMESLEAHADSPLSNESASDFFQTSSSRNTALLSCLSLFFFFFLPPR